MHFHLWQGADGVRMTTLLLGCKQHTNLACPGSRMDGGSSVIGSTYWSLRLDSTVLLMVLANGTVQSVVLARQQVTMTVKTFT